MTRGKKLLIPAFFLALILLILVLQKDKILNFIYKKNLLPSSANRIKITRTTPVKVFNFRLSVKDIQFLSMDNQLFLSEQKSWQEMNLKIDEQDFGVSISDFPNYFTDFQPLQNVKPLSLKFALQTGYENINQYDLFQLKEIDLFEQELIYNIGRELGLIIPRTDLILLQLDYSPFGLFSLKQSFDQIFLDQHQLNDSCILMFVKDEQQEYRIKFLYRNSADDSTYTHLRQFLKLLKKADPNLIFKYFDQKYLEKFETLRQIMNANGSFVLADNLRYVFNISKNKLYPILDESNILNLRRNEDNQEFGKISKIIMGSSYFADRAKKNKLMLAGRFTTILNFHNRVFRKFTLLSHRLFHAFRINLVAEHFKKYIYSRLLNTPASATADQAQHRFQPRLLDSGSGYMDDCFLRSRAFAKKNQFLPLVVTDNRISLPAGDYYLKQDLVIPMGTVFEISSATRLRLAHGISIISYSPVLIKGSSSMPIIIEAADPEKPFGLVAVAGNGKGGSKVSYLTLTGAQGTTRYGARFDAGLWFQDTDVVMTNSKISQVSAGSGLRINQGRVFLAENHFQAGRSDNLTLENCSGKLESNLIIASSQGNATDGIKVINSDLALKDNRINQFQDKGIVLSQASRCVISNNQLKQNEIGIVVKDSSQAVLLKNRLDSNRIAISVYQKNPAFSGGQVYLAANSYNNNQQNLIFDQESKVYKVDNKSMIGSNLIQYLTKEGLGPPEQVFKQIDQEVVKTELELEKLSIGGIQASINHEQNIVFVRLPRGSGAKQPVKFTVEPGTEFYLTPILTEASAVTEKIEDLVPNHSVFNFGGYIFYGKIILRKDLLYTEYDLYITDSGLAVFALDTRNRSGISRQIKNEPKIPCSLTYFPSEKNPSELLAAQNFPARIEGRGQKWPKWKYGFILDKSVSLEGMTSSRKWVFESSFVEKSLMRSKLSFDLLKQIRQNSHIYKMVPDCDFVEIILDDDYIGVYLLFEHINKNFAGLADYDKNEEFNSCLYRAENRNANFTIINTHPVKSRAYRYFPDQRQPELKTDDPIQGWHSGFAQRHPEPEIYGEHWAPIEQLTEFIAFKSDNEFSEKIFDLLEIESYIDLWVFTQLIDDSDGIFQNRYIARNKGVGAKWYFLPWDKDGVMGRDYKMDKRPYNEFLTTHLFERCLRLEHFKNAFINRWQELYNIGIISTENIFRMIEENKKQLEYSVGRNFKRWPADDPIYPDKMDYEQEIIYLKSWIARRINWLNKKINSLRVVR